MRGGAWCVIEAGRERCRSTLPTNSNRTRRRFECFSNGRKKQLHGVTHHTLSIPIHDL